MNNDHSQKEVIAKILSSKEFVGCKIEKKLLEYLHEATLAGKGTKEIAIAMEVFAKSASFNTAEDPIVRVHIHKLRKKLQTYYLTEGKDDKLKIEIPKGSYEIKFETVKPTALKLPAISKILPIVNVFLFVILVSTLLYRWQCSNKQTNASNGIEAMDRSSPIWGDLLTNQAPTQIVLGNQFFFLEGPPSYPYRISRITSINSAADLTKYLSTRKDTSTSIIPYKPELFEKEILWSLAYLLPKFQSTKTPFELTASSELKWQDLEKNNILFIGTNKTMGILQSLLTTMHIKSALFPHRTIVKYGISDSERVYLPQGISYSGPRKDHVIVYKLPGPNLANSILIL